ncbi:MAG: FAD-binding protein [Oscillospiraceae bacterium]|jgi:succinate dehydrogenase/fumarate reductase flavoprotein subunit|nr:FAD-binding protein [Oscillospiraceae bacterium]
MQIETVDNNNSIKDEHRGWSWETPPAPIPESEIVETVETEIVVIGGGIAGLAAGARAAELGQKVVVLEKSKGLVARGAHIASVGSKTQRENGVFIDKKQFARDWLRICGSRVNEDLLWLYINKSEEAYEWLVELGGDAVESRLFGGYYRGPDFTEYPGTHYIASKPQLDADGKLIMDDNGRPKNKYRYGGAMLYCEILQDTCLQNGGQIIRQTRAEQLEKNGDKVTAVIAKGEDGKYRRFKGTKAVILATGDIGADKEMLAAYCPIALVPNRNGYYPPGLNTGDGHKMGFWAGAAAETAPWALSLHLIAYALYAFFFLHVNRQGKRFMNEDTWVQAKAIRCLMQPQGDWAFSVFDAKWFDELTHLAQVSGGQFVDPMMCDYGNPWNSPAPFPPGNTTNGVDKQIENYVEKGFCYKADTIEELAEKADLPVENLVATVNRYNEIVKNQDDVDYGKRSILLTSITKPPYYALKWGPAFLNVHGGLLVDTGMRILDAEQKPIPGLYGVGNVTGGLYGVDYPLLFNGNSHSRALVWARAAIDSIINGN